MDPRERADATLARARARGTFVVTPESAISPMDAANTLQIPRSLVAAIDRQDDDPEATMVVPAPHAGGRHQALPRQGQRPEDEGPAIAQEALTQVVQPPPARRPRHGRTEPDHQTTPLVRGQRPPAQRPAPPPEPVDGLVPTVKQPPDQRSTLSKRLDG